MLRIIRTTAAAVCLILITLVFLDFTGTARVNVGWLTRIQLVPALLALNAAVAAALIVLTLLLGRVYCSVICPLGVFQDGISWISRKLQRKKKYAHQPALNGLRYGMLAAFVAAFIAGLAPVVALLEPYSAYGRIASNLWAPVYRWGNNLAAYFAARRHSDEFYTVDVWLRSAGSLGVAILTLGVIGFLAWRNGRAYCNTVCPVGTVLGFFSRFAFLKPVIHLSKCNGCRQCERNCKASCIDAKAHQIDYSRCVACMNCVAVCSQSAIRYGRPAQPSQPNP